MNTFRYRAGILLFFLLAWSCLAGARLFYYSVYARSDYIAKGSRLAWRQGNMPARRGKIMDKNKRVLAWNERYFDLFLTTELAADKQEAMFAELKKNISDISRPEASGKDVLLKKALTPEDIVAVSELRRFYPALKVSSRLDRRYVDYSRIRKFLGSVRNNNGVFTGMSGIEAKRNDTLSGVPGAYIVMLDRKGEWIRGTWKLLKEPVPGSDVILDKTLEYLGKELGD